MDNTIKDYETEVTVKGLKCIRCSHEWIPRKVGERPLTCPHCHSAYWYRQPIRAKKTPVVPESSN
jgi:DNA-directed RNA polymerase subunit RPC12/RpoP